jgi:hypothetical protein
LRILADVTRKANALCDRWSPELIEQAAEAFRQNTVLSPFPPLTVDGRQYQDLRGLPIRQPVQNTVLEHVDFTSARFDYNGLFKENTAVDCLFINATLDTNVSGSYRHCRFDGATLDGASIFAGTTFSECTFVKADLKNAKGFYLTFDRCDFAAANFRGVHFGNSEFFHCKWDDVRFAHTSLDHSKITRAGFPAELASKIAGRFQLPAIDLDFVEWLDSPPLDVWAAEFEKLMADRAALERRKTKDRLIAEGRAAFKAKRFEDAIHRFAEAAEFGPLDELSEKMLGMARRSHPGISA